MALLELTGVTKRFGEVEVCRGIDLTVAAHEMVCLIGASGSGKSTLLRCINLLEPIDDGVILLDGQDISEPGLDPQPVRQRIGIVFQSFNLFPHMSAFENVALAPRRVRGQSRDELRAPIEALFARFGLGDRLDHYPVQLSGGEQQRVALARAFINRPKVLFADEPTGNLDADTSQRVEELLFELNRESGTTLVLVTHDLELAGKTQRVIRLRGGRVVEDGDPM